MESLQIAMKRKKRRTRKCLDEIRKRSWRNSKIFVSENECISKPNIQNNYITSERLTLSMFSKAIRSETITRPELAELNQKPKLNLDDLVKGTKVLTTCGSFVNVDNFSENNSSSNSGEYSYIKHTTISNNSNDNISNHQVKSSESFDLYSPMNLLKSQVREESLDEMGVLICTPPSTENRGYNLYEEFMSDIPKYLKHNTSAHSEDVMKDTKVLLHKLFIENCKMKYENNIFKCLKSTPTKLTHPSRDIIVHEPLDYLRLDHVRRQSLFYKINESLTENVNTPHSPIEPPSSTTDASDSPCSFVVRNTPEYTFYPHRLN